SDYAAMNLHDRDIQRAAKREGIAQGARETAIKNARNLLKEKIPEETIARCLDLSLAEVQKLASETE
ncbi:MAG: hypothetical protein K6G09_09095, partial [Treponema sp.]|nr:hypothetical protein [Treponema sp.]